jgi:putative RNA 2'-phosphotransferase
MGPELFMSRLSKFMSLVLRHDPGAIGLTLDAAGWAEIEQLIACAAKAGTPLTRAEIEQIVATSDKKRFALSDDGQRIRANQGHSIAVDLGFTPQTPPEVLFHGTATRFVESIRAQGLVKGSRQHVHLSAEEATAINVGKRHGKPVVLRVRAGEMARAGMSFYLSANGVWLTDAVPSDRIEFPG